MSGSRTNTGVATHHSILLELLENVIAAQFEAEMVGTPA